MSCSALPKITNNHLAGPPQDVICFPLKDCDLHQIPGTLFALLLGSAILQMGDTHLRGLQTQPGIDQRELRELSFQHLCLKGTVIHGKDAEGFPPLP